MNRTTLALPLLLAVLAGCASHSTARRAPSSGQEPIRLTVAALNDVHGWVQPQETTLGDGTRWRRGGVSLFASYLSALRADNPGGVVLLDAGDMFLGPFSSNLAEGEIVIAAYNALAFDAAAVGNHEFDYGPAGPRSNAGGTQLDPVGALAARARQARFPFLARNLYVEGTDKRPHFVDPSGVVLIERNGVKVGIVGLSTPLTPELTNPLNLAGLQFRPMVPEAIAGAAEARRLGAEVVVGLVHAGGRCTDLSDPHRLESCDLKTGEIFQFMEGLPEHLFDVVVGAHTHADIGHFVRGTPVMESSHSGLAFGTVELFLDPATRRPIRERTRIQAAVPVCEKVFAPGGGCNPKDWKPGVRVEPASWLGRTIAPDPQVEAIAAPYLERVSAELKRPIGIRLPSPLVRRYEGESPLGNAFVDALRAMEGADVALLNGGGQRADLPAGDLTYGLLYDVLPFDNGIAILQMTGEEIVRLLEVFLQGTSHQAPVLSGIRIAVERCGNTVKVTRAEHGDGTPLDPKRLYRFATTDYLAFGGDRLGVVFDAIPASRKDLGYSRDLNLRDSLARYWGKIGGTLEGRVEKRLTLQECEAAPAAPHAASPAAGPAHAAGTLEALIATSGPASALPALAEAVKDPRVAPVDPKSIGVPAPVLEALGRARRVLVMGHTKPFPDGDAVGSALGLARAMKALGKEVDVCFDEELTSTLRGLDSERQIRRSDSLRGKRWDLAVTVDLPDAAMTAGGGALLRQAAAVLQIDHHEPRAKSNFPEDRPLVKWIVPEADAACLQVAVIAAHLEPAGRPFAPDVWRAIAFPLLAGTLTDSGRFTFKTNEAISLQIFKHLLLERSEGSLAPLEAALQTRPPELVRAVLGEDPFQSWSTLSAETSRALESAEFAAQPDASLRFWRLASGRIGVLAVPASAIEAALHAGRQTDPAYNRSDVKEYIKATHLAWLNKRFPLAVVLTEEADGVKASVRSQVDGLALALAQAFDGGGHANAAGMIVTGAPLDEVAARIAAWAANRYAPKGTASTH